MRGRGGGAPLASVSSHSFCTKQSNPNGEHFLKASTNASGASGIPHSFLHHLCVVALLAHFFKVRELKVREVQAAKCRDRGWGRGAGPRLHAVLSVRNCRSEVSKG